MTNEEQCEAIIGYGIVGTMVGVACWQFGYSVAIDVFLVSMFISYLAYLARASNRTNRK